MTSLIALHIALSARLGLSGGNRLAEIKPIPNQPYQGRARATPIQSAHIYVTALRDHPGQGRRPARFSPSVVVQVKQLFGSPRPEGRSTPLPLAFGCARSHPTACWLNQTQTYLPIFQRKVLIPNDFSSLAEVRERLLAFQHHYEQIAVPFQWTFTAGILQPILGSLLIEKD